MGENNLPLSGSTKEPRAEETKLAQVSIQA
jgi:hypothetical protein